MKLLRIGDRGQERPAVRDEEGRAHDASQRLAEGAEDRGRLTADGPAKICA